MQTTISVAIVGDFNPANRSHVATNHALEHCSAALGLALDYHWIGTEQLAQSPALKELEGGGGFWIAPGSPYRSMVGALAAIRLARERLIPLLGTCGGFQHMLLEYARNVLGLPDADHEEMAPNAPRLFISRLACTLVGRTLTISLQPDSMVAQIYGRTTTREEYHCNFGVNPDYLNVLRSGKLKIVGSDDEGVARVVELAGHPFFIGTLFIPQLTSRPEAPHPLVAGFLKACSADRM